MAEAAAKLSAPEKEVLKEPSQFRIVGKRTRRLNTPAKVNGTAQFGIDVKLPGMVCATLAMCPVIGGQASGKPIPVRPNVGDADGVIASAAKVAKAEYHKQNVSHAPVTSSARPPRSARQ